MTYDLIVIGGGPAGMMAASRAAERGARVLLLEKNKRLGIKLLTTGHGRCNLTNLIGFREMIKAFGDQGKFLFSAFSQFTPEDTITFFRNLGIETKIEENNRVFPVSDRAIDVLQALMKYLNSGKAEIIFEAEVSKIIIEKDKISNIEIADGRKFFAENYLISTGGKSYPTTGSTGDGYGWLKDVGHKIIKTHPALTPVVVDNDTARELEGISLKDVKFIFKKDDQIIDSRLGDAIFTANGLSGPAIFAASGAVARALPGIQLIIDFFPGKSFDEIDVWLRDSFLKAKNKQIKNVLIELLPERLISKILVNAKIKLETEVNQITKIDRQIICHALKEFELKISDVVGYHKAMVTTGGVDLSEIDPKTMRSKIIKNLLVAGEVLNLDGPTGGFNLQLCWSTGRLAGDNIIL
ncbi:MAG: NAD(P)/FAD-dependent oxidoreductase [Candidatus Falkowbacteria bacterium]|nr:NAD(P)/FAD-dependent oxidoreductase [Candidatus Falkowbacteria bacterium]